jgi:putative FmdB family regulatory protein
MPIYEYKCSKCQSVFEVIQKVDSPALKKCLKCGAPVRKIISPSALQFKGSGWYITDYAKKNKKKSAPKETKKPMDSPANEEVKKTPPSSSAK